MTCTSLMCLICNQTKDLKHFEDELGHPLAHKVCKKCRDFMSARLDFLIQMDQHFHSKRGVDYELTSLYFKAYGNTALWNQASTG